jgi:hypothetical protein
MIMAQPAHPHGPTAFHEEQRFRQPWLWLMLLGSLGLVCVPLMVGLIQQLVLGEPWGAEPLSDRALASVGGATLLFSIALVVLFARMRLVTEVRDDGVHVRFAPFTRRTIAFTDIEDLTVRTYRPLREFGGWGIRYGWRANAYNVSGNRGVQLALREGKPLLLGSQRPEALADAIRTHMRQG